MSDLYKDNETGEIYEMVSIKSAIYSETARVTFVLEEAIAGICF